MEFLVPGGCGRWASLRRELGKKAPQIKLKKHVVKWSKVIWSQFWIEIKNDIYIYIHILVSNFTFDGGWINSNELRNSFSWSSPCIFHLVVKNMWWTIQANTARQQTECIGLADQNCQVATMGSTSTMGLGQMDKCIFVRRLNQCVHFYVWRYL